MKKMYDQKITYSDGYVVNCRGEYENIRTAHERAERKAKRLTGHGKATIIETTLREGN